MALPPLTEEQQAIVEASRRPEPMMVQAYAGTAKTTTIVAAAPQVRSPALALAFNRKIAEELRPRLPPNWRTMTLNGLGQLAWLRSLPATISLEIDDRKVGKLVSQVSKQQKLDLSSDQWQQARQLVGKAMQAGLSPEGIGQPLVEDSEEVWQGLAGEAEIDGLDRGLLVDLARQVLIDSIALARQGILCFDDQIYCPTILGGKWPLFPALAVDESQDLSPINQRMLSLASRPDAKLLVVGDPKQAIYAWRGADAAAMASLRRLRSEGAWVDQRLTLSFRCPHQIVARQQGHAPGFRAAAANRPGSFQRLGLVTLDGWGWQRLRGLAKGSLAILCRNNAPLLSLAFKLIRQQVAPVFAGRDIGKGLALLSRKIAKEDKVPIAAVLQRLEEWEAAEAATPGLSEAALESISDRAESLRAVAEGCRATDAGGLRAAIALLFQKDSGDLTLSTIHRAKGLEWEVVCHLDPWRIPSRRVRKAAALSGNRSLLEQEWNLKYVCETRTRNVLVEADLEGFR